MKGSALVLLIGCSLGLAFPQGSQGNRPNRGKRENPRIIIQCMAENLDDDNKIELCRNCFKDIDYSTQTGLDEAKSCAVQYWVEGVAACSTEIEAMVPGDKEKAKAALICMGQRLKALNLERCLNEAESTDTKEKLTEGSVCIFDSLKDYIKYMMNTTRRDRGGRSQGNRPGRADVIKRMILKMFVTAHCDQANDDSTKSETCVQCFEDASGIEAIATCSDSYLSPMYEECTTLLQTGTDKKAAFQCYKKVLVGNYVSDCVDNNSIEIADSESLKKTTQCTVMDFFTWLHQKNPRAAKRINHFLSKFGGEGDDDDSSEEDEG